MTDSRANRSAVRLRGFGLEATSARLRGQRAEAAAEQYFRNRGHTVVNCAEDHDQHDLLVSEYGRVQVKTAHYKDRKRKGKGTALSVKLISPNGRYYACDAFDWLCMVWFTSENVWLVLKPASALASASDPRRMGSHFSIGILKFRNMMQPVAAEKCELFP